MAKHTPSQLLAKTKAGIRAECAKQGIDDDARKAMMMRLAGVASSTALNLKGALAVMDHLRKTGGATASTPNEWAFVFRQAADRQTYLKKIYKQAQKLGALQTPPVEVMPKAYMEGIAARMAGATQPMEFCDPERLHKIVQALEVHLKRLGQEGQ